YTHPLSTFILVYQLTRPPLATHFPYTTLFRSLESSKRCYWLCQTSGWNEWAGKTAETLMIDGGLKPARINFRISGFYFFGFCCKVAGEGRWGCFGPFGPARR